MKKEDLIGLELEFILTDENGEAVNRAPEVFSHPNRADYIVPDLTKMIVEVNSPPESSISSLDYAFRNQLLALNDLTSRLNLFEVPISIVGPGSKPEMIKPNDLRCISRYISDQRFFNDDQVDMAFSITGTHIHIDQKDDKAAQYNLLLSLDPVFALLSDTSYIRGQNTLNSGRVNAYRNMMFGDLPLHGQLPAYVSGEQEIHDLNDLRYSILMDRFKGIEGVEDAYSALSSVWGPLRLSDKNTMEVRNSDSNLPSLVVGLAAFYQGVVNHVFDNDLEVRISEEPNTYDISDSEIILPSYDTLKQFENSGIRFGLKEDELNEYLSYLVTVANNGLEIADRKYLDPFKQMLASRRNMADVISMYAHQIDPSVNGTISQPTANRVNQFMRGLHVDDLAGKQTFLNYVNN
ncbi:glutamate-cysteine ligase family protein [Bacteroidota bacterium]